MGLRGAKVVYLNGHSKVEKIFNLTYGWEENHRFIEVLVIPLFTISLKYYKKLLNATFCAAYYGDRLLFPKYTILVILERT